MTFTMRNLVLAVFSIFLQGGFVNKAENITLAKPSELNSVYWNAEYANDGNPGSLPARTWSTVNPYWQGDLQEYVTVHNISVTRDVVYGHGQYLGSAYVGVSADDSIDCPNVDIFICRQCPEVVGSKYNTVFNSMVSKPMTSLTASSAMDCGLQCHLSQPCLSYSYHPRAAPNCLLTTNPEDAAKAVGWTKYTIEKCSSNIACDLTNHFN